MPRATTSSMTRKRLATSFMTKAEVKGIRQFALDWKCIGARDLDLPIIVLRVVWECRRNSKHQLTLETSHLVMETHANSTPVQVYATCMCLPKGKAKKHGHCQKSCQSFGKLFGKGRLVGRPFFKTNPQELSTPMCPPRKLLNNTKNVSIKKRLSISTLAQCFILQLMRNIHEHPMNNHDLHRVLFWKTGNAKKCINSYTGLRTWRGMIWKGIFLSNF